MDKSCRITIDVLIRHDNCFTRGSHTNNIVMIAGPLEEESTYFVITIMQYWGRIRRMRENKEKYKQNKKVQHSTARDLRRHCSFEVQLFNNCKLFSLIFIMYCILISVFTWFYFVLFVYLIYVTRLLVRTTVLLIEINK